MKRENIVAITTCQDRWRQYSAAATGKKKDLRRFARNGEIAFADGRNTEMSVFEKPVLAFSGKQDHMVGYRAQTTMFMDFPRAPTGHREAVPDMQFRSYFVRQ